VDSEATSISSRVRAPSRSASSESVAIAGGD
jgi:hypothetical protein